MVNTAKTPSPPPGRQPSPALARPAGAARRRLTAAEREQQILAGAVNFFSRRGFGAQTRELAAEIGVTHALLYHYFPTKQALIDRVYATVFEGRWDPRWEVLLDGASPAEDKLCNFYREYLTAILTPEWLRILMHSGMNDGLIPQRYFDLLRERLFPRHHVRGGAGVSDAHQDARTGRAQSLSSRVQTTDLPRPTRILSPLHR